MAQRLNTPALVVDDDAAESLAELVRLFGHEVEVAYDDPTAIAGYAQPEDLRKSADAGFDAHIAKPPDPAHIERLFS